MKTLDQKTEEIVQKTLEYGKRIRAKDSQSLKTYCAYLYKIDLQKKSVYKDWCGWDFQFEFCKN